MKKQMFLSSVFLSWFFKMLGHNIFGACSHPISLLLLSHFSRPTLGDPIDGSPPGSAIPGILQAKTLEWVAISLSNA